MPKKRKKRGGLSAKLERDRQKKEIKKVTRATKKADFDPEVEKQNILRDISAARKSLSEMSTAIFKLMNEYGKYNVIELNTLLNEAQASVSKYNDELHQFEQNIDTTHIDFMDIIFKMHMTMNDFMVQINENIEMLKKSSNSPSVNHAHDIG